MRNRPFFVVFAGAAIAASAATPALHAQTLDDVFSQGHVDGELRAYQFNRFYDSDSKPDASALGAALLLNARTGEFGGGFSLAGSLVTANALGTHSDDSAKVDSTLSSLDNSISALSQAYLQYRNPWLTVRGGYQYLSTPWMGAADSRLTPVSYNAVTVKLTPAKGWDILALRSYAWKSRTSSDFVASNLYYPSTYRDDTMYGNNPVLPATAQQAPGARALGTTYAGGPWKAQAWYYDFLRFAHLGYADGQYTFASAGPVAPFVGAQYVTERAAPDDILLENGAKLIGVGGSNIRARAWGAIAGIKVARGQFDLAYNRLDRQQDALGLGAIVSPYTTTYVADPLYTSSMLRGLVEQGPGNAWKARASYALFGSKLKLTAAYTRFDTVLRGRSHDLYVDLTYHFSGRLKGLSLRDRWERSSGGINNLNPGNQPFTYNRLMAAYTF